MNVRVQMLVWIALCMSVFMQAETDKRYADTSVLAKGKWVKIQIDKTGIYKLTYDEFKSWGFMDPQKVSIHGYGGWPLEEDFSKYDNTYLDDVPTVPVWRGSNYLLFYGRGPVKWEYEGGRFKHTNSPYSSYGYYFVTDATEVKEIEILSPVDGATLEVRGFDDYALREDELTSVNKSGRELYGPALTSGGVTLSISELTDLVEEEISLYCRTITRTTSNQQITLSVNGEKLRTVTPNKSNDEYTKGVSNIIEANWTQKEKTSLRLNISYSGAARESFLDYVRVQARRKLKSYGSYTFFRNILSFRNDSRFIISEATADMQVWDVTNPVEPYLLPVSLQGTECSFSAKAGVREFVLVKPGGNFPSPVKVGEVATQNLHQYRQADLVIIAPPSFKSEAERLKAAHEVKGDVRQALVVMPEEIYNEFSSGTPDATAFRRFLKMLYDRNEDTPANRPRYLLLFGDGSFDNRFLTADWKQIGEETRRNMLLTYQTENSLDSESYVADDYFGFLTETGGRLETLPLCLGIGRFPVRTSLQAQQMVDKVIYYMNNTDPDDWKNRLCFVADDGSNGDSYSTGHQTDSDILAEFVEKQAPEYITRKIFFDAYKKDYSGSTTYPDVKDLIQRSLKDGLFLINYMGHGNTQSWSDEHVLTQNSIQQFTYRNLPVWITATCDFCRFDAVATSAGEDVFLNAKSGGIALFTTSRVAYTNTNMDINKRLINLLFAADRTELTLGDIVRKTKSMDDLKKLGFCLIGDPALRLAYPKLKVHVTAINGVPVSDESMVLKALEKITVEGEVLADNENLLSDFNGTLMATVLDSRTMITTLGNNKVLQDVRQEDGSYKKELVSKKITYNDYANTLFSGNTTVKEGRFAFSFTVPKDISYVSDSLGKMSFYALDETRGEEAQGIFCNYTVGGTADNPAKDMEGPEIRQLFLNDSTFIDGGQVNITPLFVTRLWDQTGVNRTGNSVGHDIMLTIDHNPSLSYNLNSYYSFITDQEGIVCFPLPQLKPGVHTAEFKVWDVLNQSTTRSFTFEVVEGLRPSLYELKTTLRADHSSMRFSLSHSFPESNLLVTIFVYDLAGHLKWSHTENGSSELFKSYVVDWDLTGNDGGRLRPNVYLCRAVIRSNGSKEVTEAKKIVVLGQ